MIWGYQKKSTPCYVRRSLPKKKKPLWRPTWHENLSRLISIYQPCINQVDQVTVTNMTAEYRLLLSKVAMLPICPTKPTFTVLGCWVVVMFTMDFSTRHWIWQLRVGFPAVWEHLPGFANFPSGKLQ